MAYLVFQFPTDISAADAIHAVANHFAVGVSILGQPANVPQHIKQAVERIGAADSPDAGTEQSPAIAFGGLLNGAAAGNGIAASAQSSADAATSQTAHAVQTDTSQTSALASAIPALPPGATVTAPTPPANVAPSNPASVEFDSSRLAWDERIHSGNKTKTPGGEWRSRKGVDKNLIKSVELELRARYGAGNAPVAQVGGATVGTADTPASAGRSRLTTRCLKALCLEPSNHIRYRRGKVSGSPSITRSSRRHIRNSWTPQTVCPAHSLRAHHRRRLAALP